jgi:uncharacterized membrane protein
MTRNPAAEPTIREWRAVVALACGFAALYALYGLFRHWHFWSSAFDLGIFDQAVWHLSRFERPASSINGAANLFGDHFHPVISLFAPLYWLWPGPEALIVAQAVLLASAIVPIFAFARSRLSFGPSIALSVAYGFFWAVQRAAAYDVHEIAFAPVAIAVAVLAIEHRRWGWCFVALTVLALTKEDLIPLVGFFGVYLCLTGERRRGAVVLTASVIWFVLVMGLILPALKGSEGYAYASIYGDLPQRPWRAPLALVTPPAKLVTVVSWLAPFAFLPLASPLVVLLVPLASSRLLAESASYWGIAHHYSAPLAPILAIASADGLARLASRFGSPASRQRVIRWGAGLSVLFALFVPGSQPHWDLFEREHYVPRPAVRRWPDVAARIPSDASVVAQAVVVPHLSRRDRVYVLEPGAPDADFVVAVEPLNPWPLEHYDAIRALLDARRRSGYQVVFEQDGWIVLAAPRTQKLND